MKAIEKYFIRFLEGTDKQFVIPIYQRNYDWKKEQCAQLFDDIVEVTKNGFRSHFIGSIVSIYHDDGDRQEYLIIDGQQRIATLSLILLAIHNLIKKKKIEGGINADQIKDDYLINKWEEGDKKIKLKPIKRDMDAFSKLFGSEKNYIMESRLTENYLYFVERLTDNNLNITDFYNALKKLMIVEIELVKGEDDPQLIFESLNSTGLNLTQADLVRNFILMDLPSRDQDKLYNEYWEQIEQNTRFQVSEFIRHYLTMKEHLIPKKDKVYNAFKKYVSHNTAKNVSHNTDKIEKLLSDLLIFSDHYRIIAFSEDDDVEINDNLKKINSLGITVAYPFLLEVYNDYKLALISLSDLK